MTKSFRIAAFACVVIVAGSRIARADSIGPNCATCQGSIYTLTNLGLVTDLNTSDGVSDTWRMMLTIDTSGYTGDGVRIDEVAIKVSSGTDAATIFAGPGGAGTWKLVPGGISSDGCSKTGSGFDCADWLGVGTGALVNGSTLSWIFDVDVNGGLLLGSNEATIKARYVDGSGQKVGSLVSENITVPEPSVFGLLAAGLSFIGLRRRARA